MTTATDNATMLDHSLAGFEPYIPRSIGQQRVTLYRTGQISLTKRMWTALGSPERVQVLTRTDVPAIALRAGEGTGTLKFSQSTSGNKLISIASVLKSMQLAHPTQLIVFREPAVVDGVLFLDLAQLVREEED
ncbi:MAG TPA: hypothetical protein VNM48_11670 [Chloroflexota bacterium]|nr:hypothetical protein [Chloroflexota bacterium]